MVKGQYYRLLASLNTRLGHLNALFECKEAR